MRGATSDEIAAVIRGVVADHPMWILGDASTVPTNGDDLALRRETIITTIADELAEHLRVQT